MDMCVPMSVGRLRAHRTAVGLGGVGMEELEARKLLSGAVHVNATANDPMFSDGSLWGLQKIGAPAAWNTTKGSSKVVVADIDSGIDYTHPDLYKNVWLNQKEIPGTVLQKWKSSGVDTNGDGLLTLWDLNDSTNRALGLVKESTLDSNSYVDAGDLLRPKSAGGWADGVSQDGDLAHVDDIVGWNFVANNNNPFDDNGHGTHTAGTIGGMGNNALGVAGVNWKVQIMPLKFIAGDGAGTWEGAAAAIRYSYRHGAPISNNSWGAAGGYVQDVYDAIAEAGRYNQLFVASAGNSGVDNDTSPSAHYPATYGLENILSVAATDSADALASFSNYGKSSVDVAAPGTSVWSTLPGGGYGSLSGTSMAAPHVAGAAALLLAKYMATNTKVDWTQLKKLITRNVTAVSSLGTKIATGGRLNVAKAMTASLPASTLGTAAVTTSASSSPSAFSVTAIAYEAGLGSPVRGASRDPDEAPNGSEAGSVFQ
jgi:serine protease